MQGAGEKARIYSGVLVVRNLPARQQTQETWVCSLGREDPLQEEMATHSSILTWKIPGTEEATGLESMGLQRVRHDEATTHTSTGGKYKLIS